MSLPNETRLRNIQRKVDILTAASYSLTALDNGGMRLNNLQLASGQALTILQAANGKRGKFRFFVGTTITSNTTTIKLPANNVMSGVAVVAGGSSNGPTFATASNTNTITLNGTTTGGVKGTYIELEDVGVNQWRVKMLSIGSGALATPFSNT